MEMLLGALASRRQTSTVQARCAHSQGSHWEQVWGGYFSDPPLECGGVQRGFSELRQTCKPSLDPPQSPGADSLLSASVNHVLGDPHTLEFRMRTRSSDISIWKAKLNIQYLHVFCFHSYYLFFFFCTAFSWACCTVCSFPYFPTRWLRNEEQRPLKSGRGEEGGEKHGAESQGEIRDGSTTPLFNHQ